MYLRDPLVVALHGAIGAQGADAPFTSTIIKPVAELMECLLAPWLPHGSRSMAAVV